MTFGQGVADDITGKTRKLGGSQLFIAHKEDGVALFQPGKFL